MAQCIIAMELLPNLLNAHTCGHMKDICEHLLKHSVLAIKSMSLVLTVWTSDCKKLFAQNWHSFRKVTVHETTWVTKSVKFSAGATSGEVWSGTSHCFTENVLAVGKQWIDTINPYLSKASESSLGCQWLNPVRIQNSWRWLRVSTKPNQTWRCIYPAGCTELMSE